MSFTIYDYVGEYKIRVGMLNLPVGPTFEVDDKFYVGTGTHDDPPPTGDKVGVSIFSPDGETQKFPEPGTIAYFEMSSGNLNYYITDRETGEEYLIQFTLVEVPQGMGITFRTIYGAVVMLDPDVVGVWGADDQIP